MSRFLELLDKYQDGEESASEAEELAGLLKEHDGRARTFYDAIMLEVDLYETYAGIARIQTAPRRRRPVRHFVLAWAVGVLLIIGLIAILKAGAPRTSPVLPVTPAAPGKVETPPPEPRPQEPRPAPMPEKRMRRDREDHEKATEHDDHTPGGRRAKIERELDAEIEKARRKGDLKEVEEKVREKERKLKNLDLRGDD